MIYTKKKNVFVALQHVFNIQQYLTRLIEARKTDKYRTFLLLLIIDVNTNHCVYRVLSPMMCGKLDHFRH